MTTINFGHNCVVVAAMACLTILELYALDNGLDGAYFLPLVGAICLMAGYKIDMIKKNAVVTSLTPSKRRINKASPIVA